MGNKVTISGIDADPKAVQKTQERFKAQGASGRFKVLNFRNINEVGEKPTKILFDLGWNKSQFEEGGRGFSFQKDEPLLMTFGDSTSSEFTAYDIVNTWDAENIETIISAYGEDKFAWKISRRIVEARDRNPIKTSFQLAEIVKFAVPVYARFGRLHPATKTFQALRIAVNDELRALEEGLKGAVEILASGGRLAVITFHSLEDRIVKRYFKSLLDSEQVELLNKKPIVPSEEELQDNPRSRSAKLRVLKKLI
jgi:16S rRNA (cytosine1402-N4)-methyltransferase